METKTNTQTKVYVDEGLRQCMLRVYNYMAGGLCITALTAYIVANTPLLRLFFNVSATGAVGMSAFGWLLTFAPLIMVFAFGWVLNRGTLAQVQGMFWGFSALMGASLTPILLAYTGASMTRVFLITAAMFGGMSLYGYTTKKDLSGMGSFLIMGVWGLVIASIVNIFLQSPGLSYAVSLIAVVAFTGLAAYDTQTIRSYYYEQDSSDVAGRKAIYGALSLYLDFINIFIALLNLMGEKK